MRKLVLLLEVVKPHPVIGDMSRAPDPINQARALPLLQGGGLGTRVLKD